VIDRRAQPKIREAVQGNRGDARSHRRPPPAATAAQFPRAPISSMPRTIPRCGADVFPAPSPAMSKSWLPVGEKRYVSGTLQMYDGIRRSCTRSHRGPGRICKAQRHRSVYPLTEVSLWFAAPCDRSGAAKNCLICPSGSVRKSFADASFPPIREALNPRACAARTHRHFARWPVLVTDGVRRTLGRSTGAGAGARANCGGPAGDRKRRHGHLRHRIIDRCLMPSPTRSGEAMAAIAEDLRQPVRMLRAAAR